MTIMRYPAIILTGLLVLALYGCHRMTDDEVIAATKKCHDNDMIAATTLSLDFQHLASVVCVPYDRHL